MIAIVLGGVIAALLVLAVLDHRRPPPPRRVVHHYRNDARLPLPAPPPTPIPQRRHLWTYRDCALFVCTRCGFEITDKAIMAARPLHPDHAHVGFVYVGFARPEYLPAAFWECKA